MPKVQTPLTPTTRTGSADDATRALEHALFRRNLYGITEQLAVGASLELECMAHEVRGGEWLRGLTALSWAVALDSEAEGLFLTPLLLHHGGNIAQVDSAGRTLLDFARARSVARYLIEYGVPFVGGVNARKALLALLTGVGPKAAEERERALAPLPPDAHSAVMRVLDRTASAGATVPLLPRSMWRKALDDDHLAVLKHFGYSEQVDAEPGEPVGPADRPPLLAAFHPAELIGWALEARDADRVRAILRRGGADGAQRFARMLEVEGVPLEFRGLTATGLAVLIDCENERLSAGANPWTRRPIVAPVFTSLLMGARSLHGAHDAEGNTLLHLAVTPGMCGWLLGQGLAPDVKNNAGLLPEEVAPGYVRGILEQRRLTALPPVARSPKGR